MVGDPNRYGHWLKETPCSCGTHQLFSKTIRHIETDIMDRNDKRLANVGRAVGTGAAFGTALLAPIGLMTIGGPIGFGLGLAVCSGSIIGGVLLGAGGGCLTIINEIKNFTLRYLKFTMFTCIKFSFKKYLKNYKKSRTKSKEFFLIRQYNFLTDLTHEAVEVVYRCELCGWEGRKTYEILGKDKKCNAWGHYDIQYDLIATCSIKRSFAFVEAGYEAMPTDDYDRIFTTSKTWSYCLYNALINPKCETPDEVRKFGVPVR